MNLVIAILLSILIATSFLAGTARARVIAGKIDHRMPSLPRYYGVYTLLCSLIPVTILSAAWQFLEPIVLRQYLARQLVALAELSNTGELSKSFNVLIAEIHNIASGKLPATDKNPELMQIVDRFRELESSATTWFWLAVFGVALTGFLYSVSSIKAEFSARAGVEKIFNAVLFTCSSIAVLTTAGIISSLLFESIRFFSRVPISEFLFGLKWSPQIAMRADQVGSSGAFGSLPLIVGTVLIAAIAMCVAAPLGLFSAIYLAEYAGKKSRSFFKPLLEILAGIPTVVYGFFAALTVSPILRLLGIELGIDVSSESALAAGLVMGIMIIPFISSLSDDVINAVPQSLRDASYALGATKSETIKLVVLPAALPGIMGAILLAVSRAVGETMIVVMAAGLAANLTLNPAESVTTVTVQIVTILVGDQEFDSAKTLAAFALGLLLFCLTMVLNVLALQIVKRYREKYE